MLLSKGDMIGIVACSNGQPKIYEPQIHELLTLLNSWGLGTICSGMLYEKDSVLNGTGEEKAKFLMELYKNSEVKAVFDISGGDIANEVLDYLDYNVIKLNPKPFFGYSDLTTILNGIYTKTKVLSYLYQIKNLVLGNKEKQLHWFVNSFLKGGNDIFQIKADFLQGSQMEGVVIGGNIRCFLKLAGTPYMPDFKDKILLLESLSGEAALMTSFLNQLKQIGAFRQINGILLGTFSTMVKNNIQPTIEELVIRITDNKKLPIAKTNEIGHGSDSKCMIIGNHLVLKKPD